MQQTVAVAVTKEENVDLTTIHACGLSCFYSAVAVTDSETTMAVVAAVNNFWQKIGEFITNSPAFYKLSKTLLALRTRSSLVLHISYSLMEANPIFTSGFLYCISLSRESFPDI